MKDSRDTYTFGDSDRAAERLRLLARAYAPSSRTFVRRVRPESTISCAIDLGCGPGYSTELLSEALAARETIGLDASPKYTAHARARCDGALRFETHDVTRAPFPARARAPDFMYGRFLLTHLSSPGDALATWRSIMGQRAGSVALEESNALRSDHAAFRRYYSCVEELQARHGQTMYIGARLAEMARAAGWESVASETVDVVLPAPAMARLHVMNLATWRHDPQARAVFEARELDVLAISLESVARGEAAAPPVTSVIQQVWLRA